MDYEIFNCYTDPGAEYLVLSSGLGGHGAFWQPQIEFFRRYFHVFIYDQEGCHADSHILKQPYCIEDLALQLLHLLKQAKIEDFHFIGHALGGFIGAELARLITDTEMSVSSLTILNAWNRLDPHTAKCFRTRIALLKHAGVQAYVEAQALFLYPPAWISTHIDLLKQQEQSYIQHFPPTANVFTRLQALMDYELKHQTIEALQNIPVNLIAQQDDFLVPYQQSQALAAQLPHAVLKLMQTGGHAATVTEKALMNSLMWSLIKDLNRPKQAGQQL